MQEYITVKKAAQILGVSKRTIYRKIKQGIIPCKKVDSKIIRIPINYFNID
ncbi:helix-turn-helix domain-containing protein [Clostridium sp. Marseille-Q2269]|uniref:helix-turn-helix domain-containing protein n=1 Tax=Clostridium sp. Marseille-Q2269 TaxID=2942205 RepID=UPI0020739EB8|nr:helix-turn-helix domain-containing protein [Clostridium sp. Marseille-Q2269]